MTDQAEIGIVGLGWLGSALYDYYHEKGVEVWGTRTSEEGVEEMRKQGVNAYLLNLAPGPENDEWKTWFRCRNLVINIPPGRKDPEVETRYPKQVEQLLRMAESAGVERVVFVSSTSVFGGAKGVVGDDTPVQPETNSGHALVACEEIIAKNWKGQYAVVRFGGLYGPGRHPGRFFSGRTGIPDGDAPVNFIHRDDCVGVIDFLIQQSVRGAVLNACAPAHPPKKQFYHRAALHAGLTPPQFLPGGEDEKEVQCSWLKREGYVFARGGLEM